MVVLATKVYVYRFSDLKLLDQIDTQPNPRGLVPPVWKSTIGPLPDRRWQFHAIGVLACPGVTRGHARIRRVELYDARKSTVVAAHESDLARIGAVRRRQFIGDGLGQGHAHPGLRCAFRRAAARV